MKKILFATTNRNKLKEVREIFANLPYEIISLADLDDHDEVKEDGFSFEENAYIKAKYYFDKYHIPCMSDDSGISISYLGDYPGIHSARFLNDLDYPEKNQMIIDIMKDIKDRRAYYSCAIVYIDENGPLCFEAKLNGMIAYKAKGSNGFGYDPIFYLPSYNATVAELSDEEKNLISHRYLALRKMVKHFEE